MVIMPFILIEMTTNTCCGSSGVGIYENKKLKDDNNIKRGVNNVYKYVQNKHLRDANALFRIRNFHSKLCSTGYFRRI